MAPTSPIPPAPREEVIPWDQFLIWVTTFGNCGIDDQVVWIALDELGLADKNAFTGAEMLAIEEAVGVLIQAGLESSSDPKVAPYARLMANANKLFQKYGEPS